jgi:hypothetical protein
MTWQPLVLLILALLFACCLIISISAMLFMKMVDVVARAWRWCRGCP